MKAELHAAIEAAQRAAQICTTVYHTLIETAHKTGREPVTVADFASQAIISHVLREAFPDDDFLGEENADDLVNVLSAEQRNQVVSYVSQGIESLTDEDTLRDLLTKRNTDAPRKWIIDPIDGTKGFMNKRAYAIAIALMTGNDLTMGVLACPNLSMSDPGEPTDEGVIFYADRTLGAFYRPLDAADAIPMRVSDSGVDDDLRLLTSFEKGHSDKGLFADVVARMPSRHKTSLGLDGQGKYGLVASGQFSGYFRLVPEPDYREKVWDHAAGVVIVETAGGKMTDFDGKPLDFTQGKKLVNNRGVVATNGAIHDALLAAIHDVEQG